MGYSYGKMYNAKQNPPQTVPLPNRPEMVRNSAGGYVFEADLVKRFLILGTTSPTFYASKEQSFKTAVEALEKSIKADGVAFVQLIVEISDSGRAPRQSPALFALALAKELGDETTRTAVYSAIANWKVIRTGRQLFEFFDYLRSIAGKIHVGNGLRKSISAWYNTNAYSSALQLVKYRNGTFNQTHSINHGDIMRLAHFAPVSPTLEQIRQFALRDAKMNQLNSEGNPVDLSWSTDGEIPAEKALQLIWAFERAQSTKSLDELLSLIVNFKLTWEMIPNTWFSDQNNARRIREVLLPNMPITALIRQIGIFTSSGVFAPFSQNNKLLIDKITAASILSKGRVHPIQILSALRTYQSGHGVRGSSSWTPVPQIVTALEEAFYLSFRQIKPSGKNVLLGLDVSGSMTSGEVAGVPGLAPFEAEACMAMVTARTEPNYYFFGFSDKFVELRINDTMSLDAVMNVMSGLPFARTDCSLPFIFARENKLPVDLFVVYTDSETFAGRGHPVKELQAFRKSSGRDARSVVVGMVSNGFTIADPTDGGMLDVVGFDSAAPQIISDFGAGRI